MTATRFGALDLIANTDAELMTGPTGFSSTVNVRFVNRNSTSARIRLALVDAGFGLAIAALDVEDFLEFDLELRANGVLENTGIPIPDGFTLVVRSDTNDVTAVAYGFTEKN